MTASQHQSHRRVAHLCYCSQTRAPAPPQEADTKLGPAASSWRPGAQHCGAATHCCVAGSTDRKCTTSAFAYYAAFT
ncbi:unnamed protein product [Gadus morhua 'NCC']